MDVSSFHAITQAVKGAFLVLTALSLTAYKWPENKTVKDLSTCDFVIVGAGTAGSIIANRLSEDPGVKVCVIEAGGDPPLESEIPSLFAFLTKTSIDWNLTSEDDGFTAQYRTNKYLDLSTGKVLGGSSTINHLYHVRGDPKDYDDWAKASGDESWSWQNLLPYFVRSEHLEDEYILNSETGKYHGTNGYLRLTRENRDSPLKYLKAFKEMGHKIVEDVNAGETLGFTRPLLSISGGVRQSSASSYLTPIKDRQNLYIVKNTMVTKIIFNGNKQATGVQCTTSDGNAFAINTQKEVIISAGAFNTPKLLMLSGIGPTDHLNNLGIEVLSDLPVGQNLQDHMAVILIHKLEATTETPPAADPTKFPLPTFIGFGAVNKSQSYPDYMTSNVISRNSPDVLMQLCSSVFALHDDVCSQIYAAGVDREVLFTVINVVRPISRGHVELRSANPEDSPRIYTGFLSADADITKFIDSIEDYISVTESDYFRNVNGETMYFNFPNCDDVSNARAYWRCYILNMMDTTFHYSGTCAMGSVLDSSLRVKGVSKLRVVDASAMPNIVSSNINSAVIVLAEKAADLIKHSQTCA
ncbi:unnamed protein product [Euphydryas editha]|uniref:Glucose-methanol-choline oxidoreductase N-terminal domain-containing protein n=1 Tax=Euphydryas editha TaxID=104508 RepID=A0AAU9U429_EUPED|nr:unnamed protein product [Euphydryas editha]